MFALICNVFAVMLCLLLPLFQPVWQGNGKRNKKRDYQQPENDFCSRSRRPACENATLAKHRQRSSRQGGELRSPPCRSLPKFNLQTLSVQLFDRFNCSILCTQLQDSAYKPFQFSSIVRFCEPRKMQDSAYKPYQFNCSILRTQLQNSTYKPFQFSSIVRCC